MINDPLKLEGTLTLTLRDEFGNVKEEQTHNLVTTVGKELVCQRLKDNLTGFPTHMAVGTNSTPAAAGQTALLAEIARVAFTSATVSTNTITYIGNYPAGTGTGTLVEAGLFNDVTAGTMLSRTASINVVKGSTDTLTVTWTITVS